MGLFDRPIFHPEGPTFRELAVQALSSTDRGYDLLAPKFEYTPFRTPDPVIETSLRRCRGLSAALDLCCGTGAGLRALEGRAERVVGIDRSAGMLAEARRHVPNAELHQGDVLNLPSELRGEFDLVTCYGAFGHILEADEAKFVASVHAALRPGGRFVFVTTEPPRWTSSALWVARGFNAVMRVRNALLRPAFIMYYLTFLLPRATRLLEDAGFEVRVFRDFPAPYERLLTVEATR
ncbi:MAG: class I SAM-dependent methyltransferase [Myxococcota bacterium]